MQVCPIHVCGSARHRYTSCGTISTLNIASLKPHEEVNAFVSLNSADQVSSLGATQDSGNEDGEYFAIAVLPILPEWVASDEPKYLREDYSTSPCLLSHAPLKECPLRRSDTASSQLPGRGKATSRRWPTATVAPAASSSSQSRAPRDQAKRVSFQQ